MQYLAMTCAPKTAHIFRQNNLRSKEEDMLTAIYVSEPASINITVTEESDLQLSQLSANSAAPLSCSVGTTQLNPGIYKLLSIKDVTVTSTSTSVVIESAINPKSGYPRQSIPLVEENFAGVGIEDLRAFFTVTDAREMGLRAAP